jgi:cyclic pyranopterin phosphate synthase
MVVQMIDIHDKPIIYREALEIGEIELRLKTLDLIRANRIEKGDPLQIAKIAGIQGAKQTSTLMPLCHPLPLESVQIETKLLKQGIRVSAKVLATSKTGVEMEALTAVSAALLSIWDVTKKYEKDDDGQYPHTMIGNIKVQHKVKRTIDVTSKS